MKTALITGATGFVGANIARRLLSQGHNVHLLVRSSHKSWRISDIQNDVTVHVVDFLDKNGLGSTCKSIKPDWIFHTAVYGAYSYQQDIDQTIQTNIVGLSNLLQACLETGFESFVNTGSSSEYGYKDHAPKENEYVEPNSYYAVSKVAGTYLCRFTAEQYKVHIPTIRLYSVYGPYEEPTRLMPTLVRFALDKKLPPLVDPTIARDYVYIDDVVDAYLSVATGHTKEYGPIYNVGTQTQTTLLELVKLVQKQLHVKEIPVWGSMPNRAWDTSCWISDTQKIRSEMKWKPRHTLSYGITRFSKWIQDHEYLYMIDESNKKLKTLS